MKRTDLMLLPLVAILLTTATWSLSTQARAIAQDSPTEEPACRAQVEPDVVPATETKVVLSVSLPSDVGEVTEVRSEDGSGIDVVDFGPGDTEMSPLAIRLDIAEATTGTWWLEFKGEARTCMALLTVVSASAPSR